MSIPQKDVFIKYNQGLSTIWRWISVNSCGIKNVFIFKIAYFDF